MSKSPRPPIPLRPNYGEAASVRALTLAITIARARQRHGRESKFEPELRRSEAALRACGGRRRRPPRPKLGAGVSRGRPRWHGPRLH
jgi:hypothetical protein